LVLLNSLNDGCDVVTNIDSFGLQLPGLLNHVVNHEFKNVNLLLRYLIHDVNICYLIKDVVITNRRSVDQRLHLQNHLGRHICWHPQHLWWIIRSLLALLIWCWSRWLFYVVETFTIMQVHTSNIILTKRIKFFKSIRCSILSSMLNLLSNLKVIWGIN
jgi:hypothetical protein